MPMLWWPDAHCRDRPGRLHAALWRSGAGRDPDRHLMTPARRPTENAVLLPLVSPAAHRLVCPAGRTAIITDGIAGNTIAPPNQRAAQIPSMISGATGNGRSTVLIHRPLRPNLHRDRGDA